MGTIKILFPEFKICMLCYIPFYTLEGYYTHLYSHDHYNIYYDLNFRKGKKCILCDCTGIKDHMNTKRHNNNIKVLVKQINKHLYTDIIKIIISYLPANYIDANMMHIKIAANTY